MSNLVQNSNMVWCIGLEMFTKLTTFKYFSIYDFSMLCVTLFILAIHIHLRRRTKAQLKLLKEIEKVMVDGSYNDPDYLIFSNMTVNELQNKAKTLKIPDFAWGTKQALAHVLRLTDQLNNMIEIVQPIYPDGYETEDMSDSE